ncbi:MAG: branched-chain amino acid ABC transporter permease [Rhizobiales bacterium]|jgi:branched-chain amino acid transport system permease protein
MLEAVASQVVGGLSRGMVMFVVATGLTLIFGSLRIANFAHGAIYMLGAYVAFSVSSQLGFGTAAFVAALVGAPIVVGALGFAVERGLLRRIAHRSHYYQIILTYAVALIIADLVKMIWGVAYLTVPRPSFLEGAVFLGSIVVPVYNLFLIAVGLAVLAAIHVVFNRTRFGTLVRASVLDGEMLGALGTDVRQLQSKVFVLGCMLAGLGGALSAPASSVSLGMDHAVIIESFAVVLIGGVGSIVGALAGSLIVGLAQALGILFAPEFAATSVYIILALVMLFRRNGLFGGRVMA